MKSAEFQIPGSHSGKIGLMLLLTTTIISFSCSSKETFECPCGGYGVVAHGSIVTIEEVNRGDTRKILDAIESALGGKCCYRKDDDESDVGLRPD